LKPSILDTTTLSEILSGHKSVSDRARLYLEEHGNIRISSMTFFETQRGLVHTPKPKKAQALIELARTLIVLPTRKEEAELAGTIHGLLKRQGQPIGEIDPIIAATAITFDLVLATSNVRHFRRVVDLGFPLQIEDWKA